MIFGQLTSSTTFLVWFHTGTRKLLSEFWPHLVGQAIKFVLIVYFRDNLSLTNGRFR